MDGAVALHVAVYFHVSDLRFTGSTVRTYRTMPSSITPRDALEI